MAELVITADGYYKVDPLYQWDLNQILYIYGVNVPTPIIHFTNSGMGASINRYGDVDKTGVISVKIPNSLLQKNSPIIAYICGYEGETFKTYYKLEIPVKTRTKPSDYTLEVDDEEVYSFEKYTKLVYDAINEYESKYNNVLTKLSSCESNVVNNNTRVAACEDKVSQCETGYKALTEHVNGYDDRITQNETDIKTLFETDHYTPWNIDENVSKIHTDDISMEIDIGANDDNSATQTKSLLMINSGTIELYLQYRIYRNMSKNEYFQQDKNYIKIYQNETLLNTLSYTDNASHSLKLPITVNKGDILSLHLAANRCCVSSDGTEYIYSGTDNVAVRVSVLELRANVETQSKYIELDETRSNPTTTEILNALLGVE